MRTKLLTMLAAVLLLASTAGAQPAAQPTLKVGDKAPPLGKGEWVKGEPVSEFESGKVYVIENWATWCGPCIAAIPHITELQKKYEDKGLVVIGQNVWEDDPAAVKPFVEKMGDKMDYRVVMDEPSGQEGYMAKTYLQAAGQNGIPCAFVIDQKGTIAWIGHPMAMAPVLEKVIAGDFDPKAEAERAAKVEEIGQRLNAARRAGKTDEALEIADELGKADPSMAGRVAMVKYQILSQADRWDEAFAELDRAIDDIKDPEMLNQIAWPIVDPENPHPKPNLDVALKAAEKANKLTESKRGDILDTLARVYWLKGDKAKALELQEKAVEVNDNPQFTQELADRLEEYKKGQQERNQ